METTYRDYTVPDKLFQGYTPNEKKLRQTVCNQEFTSFVNSKGYYDEPLTVRDVEGLFETYTMKFFPIPNVDPVDFLAFVVDQHHTYKPKRYQRLSDDTMRWWTKDPRGKNNMNYPIVTLSSKSDRQDLEVPLLRRQP